ncbi:MAG: SDR family NAD(P)-dependent oxidoreductase [Anaerolineales bacterium]
MRGFLDKRVLITGGTGGIGAATAKRFLNEGARLAVLDRDVAGCQQVDNELPAFFIDGGGIGGGLASQPNL